MPVRVSKTQARILQRTIDGGADDVTPVQRNNLETQHQILLVAHCRFYKDRYAGLRWLYANLNGVKLTPKVVKEAKAMGMEKGLFDLHLHEAGVDGKAGLALDMKIPPNGPTREQREWQAHLRALNWTAEFPCSALAGWKWICRHLGINDIAADQELERRQALLG
jgi:hypothetical protein